MANKPKIRFKGFDDAWEQRKLLSCIQSITDFRGRTPKKLGMDWSESGYLALSALNVKDGYIDFSQDVHYGNQELYDKWMSGKELHRGQVLFTTEAPMGNVAQVPDNKGYILSQRTIAFDVEEKILSENFLATLLRTPNVFNDLTALSSGGTAKGVSQKSLSGLDVVIPKNIDEQNKLADYFINLDNLITLHQRNCDQMKELKKYMLTKMFPQNGAKVPEIRFDGFIDDWEQRKLDDVVEFLDTMRKPLEGAKRISGSYPYYGASGIVDYVDGYLFDEELILLSEDGANITDRNYPVCFLASGKYWVNNHAHVLRTKQGNENNFICNSLEQKDYTQYNTGMAMPKLNKETCKKIPVSCPEFKEQKKIGDYFRSLDHLITLHQSKCENLKNLKEYMLRNMFV